MTLKEINARLRRKIALDFANSLSRLADGAPDELVRRDLYRAVHRLRLRSAGSREKKLAVICHVVGSGATTVEEISNESGFSVAAVRKILKVLVDEKKVRAETMGGVRNRGRGRTKLYYFIA